MAKFKFTKDDNIATLVTIGINGLLLLFSLWFTIDLSKSFRPSFIEVEFGEYQTGTEAEQSLVEDQEVAKRPNPSEVEAEEPKEEVPTPEKPPQQTTEEVTKQVDLPDEIQKVEEDPVTTPETEKVDPQKEVAVEKEEEVVVPPVAKEDDEVQDGAEESGDVKGEEGETEVDEGDGNDEDKTAPFELKWEGDLERAPLVQPLPQNNANVEATITVRFQVRPNGTVGRIIPLRKMSPELETEVLKTLRSWRFSRLPSGAPQQPQWGTITFRFVFG